MEDAKAPCRKRGSVMERKEEERRAEVKRMNWVKCPPGP